MNTLERPDGPRSLRGDINREAPVASLREIVMQDDVPRQGSLIRFGHTVASSKTRCPGWMGLSGDLIRTLSH
jgi:hypothetical protein